MRRALYTWTVRALALVVALALVWSAGEPDRSTPVLAAEDQTATVVAFSGSDRLEVVYSDGERQRVQYIGVRGPLNSSRFTAEASAVHGPLIMGQQVRLERDGADSAEGYQLRHVYLAGEQAPIAARLVSEGWARAVPYPIEHRYRGVYLGLQERAMAEDRGLWRAGVLGPARAWRSAPGSETYIAADPRLHGSFSTLATVPTGREVIERILRHSPAFRVERMPPGALAFAEPLGQTGALNAAFLSSDPRAVAAALAHESVHLIDMTSNAAGLTDFGCFDLEVRSHALMAQIWLEFYGPGGKPSPRDDLEWHLNHLLEYRLRGDVDSYVRLSSGYQQQCAREGI
jgi:endonuclease YncB( thermonuclease family)